MALIHSTSFPRAPAMLQASARHVLRLVLPLAALHLAGQAPAQSNPQGRIDPSTWVHAPLDTFGGVPYARHEAMFEGVTANQRPFRVPCQIIAPVNPAQGS